MSQKLFPFLAILIYFYLFSLESRPGMGGSYRSSSSGSSSSSFYRSSSSSFNRDRSYSSSSSSSSDRGGAMYTSQESFSDTVPSSPILDLYLKICKNGSIEVREDYKLDPQIVQKPIERVDADILRGIMSNLPQNREKVLKQYFSTEKNYLSYTLEKVFHPIYNIPIAYIYFQQPYNLENYSITIEKEEGLGDPEINFWLSSGGSSDYSGMQPFSYFNSEQKLEIGKKYEFTKNEYRYTMFFYIQYSDTTNSPTSHPLELPSSHVSYKTKIEVSKSKYTSIQTEIQYRVEEGALGDFGNSVSFPKNNYYDTLGDYDIFSYFFKKSHLPAYYSSFGGDWENSFSSDYKNIPLKSPEGSVVLPYETYGNFIENKDRLEFDFHIPYIPLKEYKAYLKSFEIELVLPEGATDSNTEIHLYASRSGYTLNEDPSLMELPLRIEGNNRVFTLISPDLFIGPGRLILNLEIDKSIFSSTIGYHIMLLIFQGIKNPLSKTFIEWTLPVLAFTLFPLFILWLVFKKGNIKAIEKPSIQELSRSDSNFQLEEFEKIAGKIAFVLQDSWNSGSMKKARAFISAGLYSRLNVQLNLLLKVDGIVNRMDEFSVQSVELKSYTTENEVETLHLLMNFKAKDISFPKDTTESEIQKKLKSSSFITYSEIYSFTRKVGAKTNPNKHLITGNCPSCGSPADYSHYSLKCDSCGNIYNSGERDWVLSEITQVSEWEDSSTSNRFQFSPQVLEDRASAVFWKYLHSKVYGNIIYIQRDASHKFISNSNFSAQKIYIPVVGAVNLQSCKEVNNRYEAKLQIKWSCAVEKNKEPEGREANLLLVKNSENKESKFSETICSNCGAPFPERDALNCEYCSTPIPEKVNDWLLEEISELD